MTGVPLDVPKPIHLSHLRPTHNLPHRRRTRVITTTFSPSHIRIRTSASPRDHPRQTCPRHARGPRPKTTHANGVPRVYTGDSWHDSRHEGTHRGGNRTRARCGPRDN